ncbi:MAG: C45 family autoproteolytic acyltransferase/hydrolase [Betaproteobacteria bacterium]|nr:C45 family autoproteolytic acyltransferase/hydrolase [Betaproteobacteria bacterium]
MQYLPKRFQAVDELYPAEKWLAHYKMALPAYRRWFASEGELKRPGLAECQAALQAYMPEMLPVWQHLLELAHADDNDARLLSFYCPAPYLSGCSQAVWTRYTPVLVRNYDYAPEHCEARIMKTNWHHTPVIASTDCLWGALDGMNEHGLAASLAFGGDDTVTEGFALPVILRYVLELCTTVDEAVKVLQRVPAHMAYNVTLLDAYGEVRTVELTPYAEPKITYKPYAVNHQGEHDMSNFALFSKSYERQQHLVSKLYDPLYTIESFINAFEYSPLFTTNYAQGFGTLYTAIYNPQLRAMEYRWPNRVRMYQSFAYFEENQL